MEKIKVDYSAWDEHLPTLGTYASCQRYVQRFDSLNKKIKSINDRISYTNKALMIDYDYMAELKKNNELYNDIEKVIHFKIKVADQVDNYIDSLVYSKFNDENSAVELLDVLSRKEPTTANTIGIIETRYTTTPSVNGGESTKVYYDVTKQNISFEDLFSHQSRRQDEHGNSFKKLLSGMYIEHTLQSVKSGEHNLNYEQYIDTFLNVGDIEHSVDKGIFSTASFLLDTVGIISFATLIFGVNPLTGEVPNSDDSHDALGNVMLTAASFGAYKLAGTILNQTTSVYKFILEEMATGIVVDQIDKGVEAGYIPQELSLLLAITASYKLGNSNTLDNMFATKSPEVIGISVDSLKALNDTHIYHNDIKANVVEKASANSIDITMSSISSANSLYKAGVNSIDTLKEVGIDNIDALIAFGIVEKEQFEKFGIYTKEDLYRLGITNEDFIAVLGF